MRMSRILRDKSVVIDLLACYKFNVSAEFYEFCVLLLFVMKNYWPILEGQCHYQEIVLFVCKNYLEKA